MKNSINKTCYDLFWVCWIFILLSILVIAFDMGSDIFTETVKGIICGINIVLVWNIKTLFNNLELEVIN